MTTPAESFTKLDPMDIPNLNEQGLFEYLHLELGIPMGRNTIARAVQTREIVPTVIARKNLFSRSDGLKWIAAQRGKSVDRPVAERRKPRDRYQDAARENTRNALLKQVAAQRDEIAALDSALAQLP